MGPNKDGRNFFLWLVFMVFIFVGMAVLEKVLEVPAVWQEVLVMSDKQKPLIGVCSYQ